ncbi:unnamed protein product [Chrysoparadoxa australica]
MEPGSDVWVRDTLTNEAWIPGTVTEKTQSYIKVEVDQNYSEEPLSFDLGTTEGVELDDLKPANDPELVDTVEDLIQLPHLHEAAILHSLCKRFYGGDIYTFTANSILLAVNPFKSLPLYGKEILQEYYNHGYMRSQGVEPSNTLGPHVFAIADSAYRAMMHGIHSSNGSSGKKSGAQPTNQSILVSGESGAGKTESTKASQVVMKFLTAVGNTDGVMELAEGSIMDRVLQSNPILEAFGNARTIRNDNSSRFGKYIDLQFDRRGNLLGAGIETYLLETVRIPNQSPGERNFHIFYQITKGADDDERERWSLGDPEDYYYCNQGECYELRRVEDGEEFLKTKRAMSLMGISESDSQAMLDLVAGLLHLGQLEFDEGEDEGAVVPDDPETVDTLETVCRLCSLPAPGLTRALTEKSIEIGGGREVHTIKLRARQASDARDALAKAIYGQLFLHIVTLIKENISCDKKQIRASVGVLDIFGFECFANNSFEQLCINFTNEHLQQQFNQFVFKMEQKEYTKEGIEWSFVEFPDNQDCLDLIEGKVFGMFAMLDDECRMGIRGTDKNYVGRLYKEHEENPRFYVDSAMRLDLQFGVRHYAGKPIQSPGLVVYSGETFCDKNRDELPKETNDLFASSTGDFVRALFQPTAAKTRVRKHTPRKPSIGGTPSKDKEKKPTVCNQFKGQLQRLMEMIRETHPHYIRCIKPNDSAEPDEIDRVRVMEQLRYGGVLEAVRVARSGYPVRMGHKDFYLRYRMLLQLAAGSVDRATAKRFPVTLAKQSPEEAKKTCLALVEKALYPALEQNGMATDTIQFGKTKVFLRKNAYDILEMLRSKRLVDAATRVQAAARGFVYRSVYLNQRSNALCLQRVARGMLGRQRARHVRRQGAATRLQTAARCVAAAQRFRRLKEGTLTVQCLWRGNQARATYKAMREDAMAVRLQKWVRGHGPRRGYIMLKSACLALQCRHRCKKAKAVLKGLKLEAKDVGNLKKDNENLKQEIAALKDAAARRSLEKRNSALMEGLEGTIAVLTNEKEELQEQLEKEREDFSSKILKLEQDNAALQEELERAMEQVSLHTQQVMEPPELGLLPLMPVTTAPGVPAEEAETSAELEQNGVSLEQGGFDREALMVQLDQLTAALEAEQERGKLAQEAAIEAASAAKEAEERLKLMSISVHRLDSAATAAAAKQGGPEAGDDELSPDELGSDDVLIHGLVKGLEEERESRRAAEVENVKLRSELEQVNESLAAKIKEMEVQDQGQPPLPPELASFSPRRGSRMSDSGSVRLTHTRGRSFGSNGTASDLFHSNSLEFDQHGHDGLPMSPSEVNRRAKVLLADVSSSSFANSPGRGSQRSPHRDGREGTHFNAPGKGHHVRASTMASVGAMSFAGDKQRRVVDEFEERLSVIKRALYNGVNVHTWDGNRRNIDTMLTFKASLGEQSRLNFQSLQSYMLRPIHIKPLVLDSTVEVLLGHRYAYDLGFKEEETCLTLLQVPSGAQAASRTIVLSCQDKDQRNDLYSGLRKLLTEVSFESAVESAVVADAKAGQMRDIELKELTSKYERVMVQMLEMTNDLNVKEEEARGLKRTLTETRGEIARLREARNDDANVSMQLVKKMEDLQFDIEDYRSENAMLKQKVQFLNSEVQIVSANSMMPGEDSSFGEGDATTADPSPSPLADYSRRQHF